MTMKGSVSAYGKPCPVCGGEWATIKDQYGDTINIVCREHFTSPERFAVDGRAFKNRRGSVGRLFRDERGELLYSFHAAKRLLESIRHDWDKLGGERFDPEKWSRSGRATYKIAECHKEWQLRLEQTGRSRSYCRMVESMYRLHILPALGTVDIRELTGDDIEKLQLSLKGVLSHNSIVLCLSVLNSLLKRYVTRKQVMDRLPVFPEKWSTLESPKRRVVTIVEQRSLIARMVWRADKRIRWNLLLLLKTYTFLGCRPGEVCALKRRHILEDGRVQIEGSIEARTNALRPTKTGKGRIGPAALPEPLLSYLRSLPVLPEAYLFTAWGGKPFNPSRLSKWFGKVCDMENVTFYTFSKHSLATRTCEEAQRSAIQAASSRVGVSTKTGGEFYIIKR